MTDAIITLVGNVASEVRTVNSERGTTITSFRFAHTPRRIDRQTGRWGDGPTSFYGVTCWRTLAEHCRDSLHKGDPVVLLGRLRIRDWRTKTVAPAVMPRSTRSASDKTWCAARQSSSEHARSGLTSSTSMSSRQMFGWSCSSKSRRQPPASRRNRLMSVMSSPPRRPRLPEPFELTSSTTT